MTDNEKAATFISRNENGDFYCYESHAGAWGPHWCKDIPDMLLASNWSRVIQEYLIPKLYMISFYEGGYEHGDPFICSIKSWHQADLPEDWRERYIITESTKSLGHAIMLGLAKLYDLQRLQENDDLRIL